MALRPFIRSLIPVSWHNYIRLVKYSVFRSRSKFKGKSTKDTFTEIYKTNHWKSEASHSGAGSDLTQTRVIRKVLPEVFKQYGIKSMLDAPCGDFNWMKEVDLTGIQYIGGDIVEELIQENKRQFTRPNIEFSVLDITTDPMPKVDLIFCRDALVHLSYELIGKALANMKASGSAYLFTTVFTDRHFNFDIATGDWRTLNLQKAPFHFPEPLLLINEECTEAGAEYADKSMALWKISDMPDMKLK